ncbi:MAG: tyrosine-type recombinase/integrase, partial [Bacteroidaceae bacterium]|nr:tyrosine-type recombinase/integrase [Bacteroidaceae bacterium]
QRLEWMEEQVSRLDYERAVKGFYLTQEDVRGVVKESPKAQTERFSPLSYLSLLVDSYANEINHRGTKGSAGSQTTYRVALKRLENFCREKNFRLTSFDDFDRLFFSEFTHYLYNHRFVRGGKQMQYSAITVINTLKVVKNLLHRAYDNEMTDNIYYNKVHTHTHCTVTEKIYLQEEEIERIRQTEVKTALERQVRDLFVIACFTALRISDLNQLGKAVISDKMITLYQVKTRERVQIPILKEISGLIAHYRLKGFPKVTEHKANAIIKQLAERAGVVQMVSCRENRGGVVSVIQERKCDLVSFHTARRSCITNLFRRGYPVNYIMTLSGHRSLQALQRYIRASHEDMAQAFMNLLESDDAL